MVVRVKLEEKLWFLCQQCPEKFSSSTYICDVTGGNFWLLKVVMMRRDGLTST